MHSKTNDQRKRGSRSELGDPTVGLVGLGQWGGGIISRCERFSCLALDRWKIAMMILDYLPINRRDSYNNSLASSWLGVMTYEKMFGRSSKDISRLHIFF